MKDKTDELPDLEGGGGSNGSEEAEVFAFHDKRHSAREDGNESPCGESDASPRTPTLLDEYRERTEAAERKLQEYIEAFKEFKQEQDAFRTRLGRDVERRVELQFGSLVESLLEVVDNLDLALEHVGEVPEAVQLARGVDLARRSFLETLERNGVERVSPLEAEFDPNEAEALRVDEVDDPRLSGKVTEVLRPGYRLGERVIRPARVAVGRHTTR